ncbi:MAG: serine/threonine-protein kinase [Bacteroidetes bacterium]|nr:serine/threonine-protein kinase [Bacteroidota bacterium]
MIGSKLSHYRILEELGRGGMGIVYRAEDTKLDRTVALKLLPASALASPDDRARFYREAKAAAQLNHPNIAAIHEIDEAVPEGGSKDEPRPFIAMEFIDGESLEARVKAGPMKLDEGVRIALSIAGALEAAHSKNIVHRDIKPANVMMTAKGEPKVLDFGLAKTAQSTQLTRMGSTVGTVAYMSPEQARGEEVDSRADLWALGVVLYEMVVGRSPFGGDYEQAVVYSILNEDPVPPTALRTGVPMGLEWIIAKLLAKKKEDRYQNASDLKVDLRAVNLKAVSHSQKTSVASVEDTVVLGVSDRKWAPALFGIIGALFVALLWLFWPNPSPKNQISPKRLIQPVAIGGMIASLDISPKGDKVAFLTDVVRVLDLSTGKIRDYDLPEVYVHAAFSPNGQDLLLTTAAGIHRLTLSTGAVVNVLESWEGGPRAEWVSEDYIVYEERTSVWGTSLTTTEKRLIIVRDSLNGEQDIDYPFVLPGGKILVATAQFADPVEKIGFWEIETGKNLGYLDYPGRRVQWDPSGSLIFVINGDLVALPFDISALKPTGPLTSIERNVMPEGMSISYEGTLVHVGTNTGAVRESRPGLPTVIRKAGLSMDYPIGINTFPSGIYRSASIHPNQKMAVVVIQGDELPDGDVARDLWILDFETRSRRPLTTDGKSDYPVWNSSGDSLYFVSNGASDALNVMAATGRGVPRKIFNDQTPEYVDLAISPNNEWAMVAGGIPPSIDAGTTPVLFNLKTGQVHNAGSAAFKTPGGNARHFDFSPSGKYLVYEDQGGIYVQSMEALSSAPVALWANSMTIPRWAPDELMIYAVNVDGHLEGIQVQTEPVFSPIGAPNKRAIHETLVTTNLFDVFSDGIRFLYAAPAAISAEAQGAELTLVDLHVLINVSAALGPVK